MAQYFKLIGLALLLSLAVGSLGSAASFDCNNATTETEIAICGDPELSALNEVMRILFTNLVKDGRYYEKIVEAQREWMINGKSLSAYDFKEQAEFLEFSSLLNSCSKGSDSRFETCRDELELRVFACMEKENSTTLVMNRCGGALLDVLRLVEAFEANLWKRINNSDEETMVLFEKAYKLWKEFVAADCGWRYSVYRDGTIRGQIWLGCSQGHYESRILILNRSNRFQGKDEFLDK